MYTRDAARWISTCVIRMQENWYLPHSPVLTRMRSIKGVHALHERNTGIWEVPYLPIDPADIGREYEPVVRINSQSGKGGVAFVMESMYGYKLPKEMHKEFADVIQKMSEQQGGEIAPEQIFDAFKHEYIALDDPFEFKKIRVEDVNDKDCVTTIDFEYKKNLTTLMQKVTDRWMLSRQPSTKNLTLMYAL